MASHLDWILIKFPANLNHPRSQAPSNRRVWGQLMAFPLLGTGRIRAGGLEAGSPQTGDVHLKPSVPFGGQARTVREGSR